MAAKTPRRTDVRLPDLGSASREDEAILARFPILYPNEAVRRTALRGAVPYGMSWFDAHSRAQAEAHRFTEVSSEDLGHRGLFGSVLVRDAFELVT